MILLLYKRNVLTYITSFLYKTAVKSFVFYVTLSIILWYLKAKLSIFTLFQRLYFLNITSNYKSIISDNCHVYRGPSLYVHGSVI